MTWRHGTTGEYRRGCRCRLCKDAHNAGNKAWVERNRSRASVIRRNTWNRNGDAINAERRERYASDEEYRDRVREQNNRHAARPENRAAAIARARKWAEDNRERYRLHMRASTARRRALKAAAGGTYTAADVEAQFDRQKGRCYWCRTKLKTYDVDHVVPLALGGSNGPENIVVACPHCNRSKAAKHPMDFAGRML